MTTENQNSEISPLQLKAKLDSKANLAILDVREEHELSIAQIKFGPDVLALHIPMRELPERISELKNLQDKELIVYCRSGGRSGRCVQFLQSQGFQNVLNLTGGILSWTDNVDPTLTKY